jgi:hypothetical protein
MSSNFRPTNMFGSYNNRLPQGKINPTKGVGINSYQTGNTSKNTRGFWNKDYTNDSPAPFGKARPIKHFRKGIIIPQYIEIPNPNNTSQTVTIDYNEMRNVKSSVLNNMVSQMLWLPGAYSIVPNKVNRVNGTLKAIENCKTCIGSTVVSSYRPVDNLTEKPQVIVTNPKFCCNEEYKAKKRVLPASTITKPNYYTTNYQYLQNRCQTFQQKQFNFVKGVKLTPEIVKSILRTIINNPLSIDSLVSNAKPGSPLSYFNEYVGQCYCNGAILEETLISVISEIILGMNKKELINDSEYNLLISLQFKTIQSFIQFIETTFDENRANLLCIYIYDTINNNKTLSELIEGPTNSLTCGRVYYKPNNSNFAVQGAVSSSTQILQKNYQTINKNNAINKKLLNIETAEVLANKGGLITSPFFLKAKYGSNCNKIKC